MTATHPAHVCADCGAIRSLLFRDALGVLRCNACDPDALKPRTPPAGADLARALGEARARALFGRVEHG